MLHLSYDKSNSTIFNNSETSQLQKSDVIEIISLFLAKGLASPVT